MHKIERTERADNYSRRSEYHYYWLKHDKMYTLRIAFIMNYCQKAFLFVLVWRWLHVITYELISGTYTRGVWFGVHCRILWRQISPGWFRLPTHPPTNGWFVRSFNVDIDCAATVSHTRTHTDAVLWSHYGPLASTAIRHHAPGCPTAKQASPNNARPPGRRR